MKILMSAFACCPDRGSEPGVGWNWALEAARQGHEVRVLTQVCDRAPIEAAIAAGDVPPGVNFDFFMPRWLARLNALGFKTGREGLTLQIVHLLWQFAAYAHARKRYRKDDFDIVHHITYGGIRHPTLMGGLPYPLILGPLGGGERTPYKLRRIYDWSGWCADLLRDIHTWTLRFDPITRRAVSKAFLTYAKAPESRDALPGRPQRPIRVRNESGIYAAAAAERKRRDPDAPFKLLYGGRFLYWKGMAVGLRALAAARIKGIDARLTIAGSGPAEPAWRRLAAELDLERYVDWPGRLSHGDFQRLYAEHDAFLFPSLHDSGGNVILEAFANAMPVICFDLGGPGYLVTPESGRAIAAEGRDLKTCVCGLADAIAAIARSPDLYLILSKGAAARASDMRWCNVVGGLYEEVESALTAETAQDSDEPRKDVKEPRQEPARQTMRGAL